MLKLRLVDFHIENQDKIFPSISCLDTETIATLYEKVSAPGNGGWAKAAGSSLRRQSTSKLELLVIGHEQKRLVSR